MAGAHTVEVRPMRREDAAAVAALTTELGYPSTADDIGRRYDLINNREDGRVFVADAGNMVMGWIHVQTTQLLECDARAEIWGLVVSETVRGSGIGRRLVEAAEGWAHARGIAVVSLRSNQVRTAARGFYEHLGYTVTKTQNAFRKILT
jgi:ribosomal protein S18 acetylase RimI-like enzyme